MSRPMPEPPDTMPPVHDLSRPPVGPDGQSDWDTWRRWKEQDDREWRTTQDKRLKDAEAAAEYWRALRDDEWGDHMMDDGYGPPNIDPLGNEWWPRDGIANEDRRETWERMATLPHALEVDA